MKKMHQTYGFKEQKIWGENSNSFFICHYGCNRGGFCVEHWRSRTRTRQHYTPFSLVVVVTYKDFLQVDFDSGIPSIEISYLQTGNNKQQTTNRKVNMALKPTLQWGMTEAQFQLQLQEPKHANSSKNNTKTMPHSCFFVRSTHIQRCSARGFLLRHFQYWKFSLANWK